MVMVEEEEEEADMWQCFGALRANRGGWGSRRSCSSVATKLVFKQVLDMSVSS